MKIESFRTLNAVLRGGSFAAGAADVNLSPSAVSLQMKQMEEYFGQPLFDRSALQARPNAFAAEVDAVLQDALSRLDELRRRSTPEVEGRVRLGTIEPLQVTLLPPLLRVLRERYPRLDVRLVRGRATELAAKLKTGEIDMIIGGALLSYEDYQQALAIDGIEGIISDIDTRARDITLNASRPMLSDVKVRQAIAYAIDKSAISEGLTYGYEPIADMPFPEGSPYASDIQLNNDFTYDKDKANALLDEAG